MDFGARHQAKTILACEEIIKSKDAVSNSGFKTKKCKVRLVTRGFQQLQSIEQDGTFAPVVKFSTLRIFLALFGYKDLELHQMDVRCRFLNVDLGEEIFVTHPEGFVHSERAYLLCKLTKTLYRSKQAPEGRLRK